MEEISSFSEWLEQEVQNDLQQGMVVPEDVEDSSKKPSLEARKFKSIYAYGYHFRVKSAEQSIKNTCDSRVAAIFRQPCHSGRTDQNVVNADLEYIRQIVDIIELDYGRHCIVLLVCDWVKANYRGRNATMKKDEWGFTMANFGSLVPFAYESFAFPIHCYQIFFSNDEDEPSWRVILRTEVRGRRVDSQMEQEEESEMFDMGRDDDFYGLRAAAELSGNHPHLVGGGRNNEVNKVVNQVVEDISIMFDKDIGES